jgi:hypothetical protein
LCDAESSDELVAGVVSADAGGRAELDTAELVNTNHFLQSPDTNNMCEKEMLSQRVVHAIGLKDEPISVPPALKRS